MLYWGGLLRFEIGFFSLQSFNSKSLETLANSPQDSYFILTAHYSVHFRHHIGCNNHTNIHIKISPSWIGKDYLFLPDGLCCFQMSHSFVTAVTTIPSCLRIQRVNDLSTQKLLGNSDFSESALTCTHCSRWEVGRKQIKSKVCVLKTNIETDLQYSHQTCWHPKAILPALPRILQLLCSQLIQIIKLNIHV